MNAAGQASLRYRQTRVLRDSTEGVLIPLMIAAAVFWFVQESDVFPAVGEFGRVMQSEDLLVRANEALPSRSKMTG